MIFWVLWFGPAIVVLLGVGCYFDLTKIKRLRKKHPNLTWDPFTGEIFFNDY